MDIDQIQDHVFRNQYVYSSDADEARQDENLTLAQLREALLDSGILEQYPDTGRGASCLVVGLAKDGTPIHIVCGWRGPDLVIITVYIPKPPAFVDAWTRGEMSDG